VLQPYLGLVIDRSNDPIPRPFSGRLELGAWTPPHRYSKGGVSLDFSERFAAVFSLFQTQQTGMWPGRWEVQMFGASVRVVFYRWGVVSNVPGPPLELSELPEDFDCSSMAFQYVALGEGRTNPAAMS
jgi:hypothetical protein